MGVRPGVGPQVVGIRRSESSYIRRSERLGQGMHLYTAGRVLTGEPGDVVERGGVLVDGQRITWVGPVEQLDLAQPGADPPETAARTGPETTGLKAGRTDLGDRATILPGLIDSHVHLGFDGGEDPVASMRAASDPQQLVLMLHNAAELLGAGVTTARDLGARGFLDVAVRQAIDGGLARGPRLVTATRPLTPTGGHCWFMGGECDGAEEARRMVRLNHKAGADLVKVMATGGLMTEGSAPWHAQFTEEELLAVTGEAHRLGKRVAAHCHGAPGIRVAVAAGVDTIEHCSWTGPDGQPRFDPRLAEAIAEAGIHVCPTMNGRVREVPELLERFGRHIEELHASGIPLIAGTDGGINLVRHRTYSLGLEVMAELGLPTAEVLVSATARAAAALGLGEVTGTLEPGKDADLIAVDGDPLADLTCLRRPTLVTTRGWEYQPGHLRPPQPPDPPDEDGPATGIEMLLRALLRPGHRPLRRTLPDPPG